MKFPKGVHKCKRPKFSHHFGRTWDTCDVILPNGEEIRGYLDTTWGEYFYFAIDNVWRKGKFSPFDTNDLWNKFDLRISA